MSTLVHDQLRPEKMKHQYGLIDARVTPPAADAVRAERQAPQWISYACQRAPTDD
ncbi:hypothetical protein HCJ76_31950 [Streptomyces sp. MC1]|uniref:hypothetical protein n=1 Tax=Streptomyces sp. MC1 TaxID=295105 RepID=UPI0018CA9C40|nr:hypothetical protein [Streptomyces sp. MC1]MBG7702556.1 hypothetical protein [Streptomyces sp. MC1]